MNTALSNPAKMIAHGAPRIIRNDEELDEYTAALFRLTALETPSVSELEAIKLLTLLVESYEREHYPIPAADSVSVVRFLIENQGLSQRDLIPEFGSESAVSMFLGGQRRLSLRQVQKLAIRFHLPADVFLAIDRGKITRSAKSAKHPRRAAPLQKGHDLAARRETRSAR